MDIISSDDPDATRLGNELIGNFSDLDEGFLDEPKLKRNLASVLFSPPFASHYIEIQFDLMNTMQSTPRVQTSTTNEVEQMASGVWALPGTGLALVSA